MIMHNRTIRACQVCGSPFYGPADYHYCPKCARLKKLDTVIKIRICQNCGIEFYGGPRARRCPGCAYEAQQNAAKRYRKNGPKRLIGSVDKCEVCGAEYTVNSSRQKYCSEECQRVAVLAWQREHKRGYNKKSGQYAKKQERRAEAKKICVYCLRIFQSDKPTNVCSDYCRAEQRKLNQCIADIKRGYNRDLKKYEEKRQQYRENVKAGN